MSSKPARTAFICDERFFWHNTGLGALDLPAGGWIEPGTFAENPASKRRARNLLEVSGLIGQLTELSPREATEEQLLWFHTPEYVSRIKHLSDAGGGDAGDDTTPFGRGSFEIASLAAGACIGAVEAVLDGIATKAYVLSRPPGHHAEPNRGAGFCIFNNVVLATHAAVARGCARVAIVDWDAHHGNGTQSAFWGRPDVLFISIHEDRYYPTDSGFTAERGGGEGEGYTVNIPLPSGAGDGAFTAAFQRIIVPILTEFEPDIVIASSGFDASYYDPFSHLAVTSAGFRNAVGLLSEALVGTALVCCQEGGYSAGYVPFCFQAVIEALSGLSTVVVDPFLPAISEHPSRNLQPHEEAALAAAESAHAGQWRSLGSGSSREAF